MALAGVSRAVGAAEVATALPGAGEELIRAVWQTASDAMALSDPDGIVLAVNPAYEELYGYGADAVVGRSFALIFPEAERPGAEAAYREVFASPDPLPSYEATVQRRDGTSRFVEARATFVERDGRRVAMLSVIRDISRRQRLLQDVEDARSRLEQVLDALPEAVDLADAASGEFAFCNVASRQLLGMDLTGQPVPTGEDAPFGVRSMDGSPLPARELPLQRALLRGETILGEQFVYVHPDGREIPLLANTTPLRDGAGAIVGAVAAYQDISAIKELERQKDDFLASVSHDLQQPLSIISGRAQLLRRRLMRGEALSPERVADGLAAIEAVVDDMAAQIRRLLDTVRLRMGRPLDLRLAPTDLVTLARQAVEAWADASERHAIRLDAAVPTLEGSYDAARLRQALDNLLSNATKYSPEGGEVVVSVREEQGAPGRVAVLAVRDQGLGIALEDQPRVFERFYRAPGVAGLVAGTGLGLVGVKQIVEQHGGTIEVASEPGQGSTFTIRLPL